MRLYLVEGAGNIALRSYSMWSFYLSAAALVLPNLLYWFLRIETDPYLIGWASFVFFIAGILGRLIDQTRSGRTASAVFIGSFLIGAAMVFLSIGEAVVEDIVLPEPEQVSSAEQSTVIQAMSKRPPVAVVPGSSTGPATGGDFLEMAVPFIGRWEGLRLAAYKDIVGVWTVCYGETKGVRPGDTYTKAQCDAMLAREIGSYRRGLNAYFTDKTRQFWLPREREVAYVSLSYNVGVHGAGKSTATRRLNSGDIEGGCEALTWWNKAGGRVVRGLVRRRTDEHALCVIGLIA